jgi:hypothetical protein
VVQGEDIIDLQHVLPSAPRAILKVLAGGAELRRQVAACLPAVHRGDRLESVKLEAPGPEAQTFLSIGKDRQKPFTTPILRYESDIQLRNFFANGERPLTRIQSILCLLWSTAFDQLPMAVTRPKAGQLDRLLPLLSGQ